MSWCGLFHRLTLPWDPTCKPRATSGQGISSTHLKMKMKSISNMQNVATLSMVFMRTTSWRWRAGMKRTSFRTRMSRKVRSTESPPPCWPTISHTLRETESSLQGEETKPNTSLWRRQRQDEIQMDRKRTEMLPVPLVSWTPPRLAKKSSACVRATSANPQLSCRGNHSLCTCRKAKKLETCFIGHWVYRQDPRLPQCTWTGSFLFSL